MPSQVHAAAPQSDPGLHSAACYLLLFQAESGSGGAVLADQISPVEGNVKMSRAVHSTRPFEYEVIHGCQPAGLPSLPAVSRLSHLVSLAP